MSEENLNLPLMLDQEIILDERQKNIYIGLKKFREDIAILYMDGVKIHNSSIFQSKSNILGHIAREIDSGIRLNLTTKSEQNKFNKKFSIEELEKIETYNKYYKGHIRSIITSLNGDVSSPMVSEWIDVATKFHKYAHIAKKEMKIKNPKKIEKLWKRFENVLYWLIGNYYDYLKRIDRILAYDAPDTVTIEGLKNIFADENLKRYFFINLKSLNWLKDLKEEGYFNIDTINDTYQDKPGTFTTPLWWPIFYLKHVSKENYAKNRNDITRILLDIIHDYIEEYDKFDNFVTDEAMLEVIYYLPSKEIKKEHINFIRIVMLSQSAEKDFIAYYLKEEFLPNLIKDKNEMILLVLELIFDFENRNNHIIPIFKNDSIKEILDTYLDPITSIFGIKALDILLKKIREINNINSSFLKFQVIGDDSDSIFTEGYAHQILACVRDMFKIIEPENLVSILEKLINDSPVMKKIAINGIETYYNYENNGKKVKNLFWEIDKNPLMISGVRPEIFSLLKKHHSSFTVNENIILINWIQNYKKPVSKNELENKEKIEAVDKLKWLEAVKDSKDVLIQKTYLNLKKIYPNEIKMPDRYISFEGLNSPKNPLKLCKRSNEKIARFLIDSNKDTLSFIEDGEYYSLETRIEQDPVRFSTDLEPFLEIPLSNQYYLLFGLYTAIINKKSFDLTQLIDFIQIIINEKSFWNYKNKSDIMNYRYGFISMVADIISAQTKLPNSIDKDLVLKMAEILILLDNKEYKLKNMETIVSSVINSIRGKIYSAMIYLSLYYANYYKKDSSDKWIPQIKKQFTKNLNNPSIEFSMICGLYLPNLLYLSPEWTLENFKKIFDENQEIVLIGYFRTNKFNKSIYTLLKSYNLLKNNINNNFDDETTNRMIVHHICAAYVNDIENISESNSLIFELIHNERYELHSEQLYEISRFFIINKSDLNEDKVRSLLKEIFLEASNNPEKYKKSLSILLKLLEIFDQLDEELFEWTMLSVNYIEVENNQRYISKYLLKFVDESSDKVAKIFLEIINRDIFPNHHENTKLLIEKLYENGQKSSADIICNKYGENNLHFLRELYERYGQ
jgi:hypothetical protein